MRRAAIRIKRSEPEQIASYMPANYRIVAEVADLSVPEGRLVIIEGEDDHGWTLDGYVLPRLASGLYFGREVDAAIPIEEVRLD